MTYEQVITFALNNNYPYEEWEHEGGYAISVWTGIYSKNNYIFDNEKNFIEWEEEDVSIW